MLQQRQQFLNYDKPDFVEDFIYKPPFEMMEKTLAANQKMLDEDREELALYGSLPIDYVAESPEARALAEAKLDEYTKAGDELTTILQGDMTNWAKHRHKLTGLKNRLSKDLLTGDLSKLSQSKKNFDAVLERFKTDKTDASVVEAGKKMLLDEYGKGIKEGKHDILENKTFLNRINYYKDFADFAARVIKSSSISNKESLISGLNSALIDGEKGLWGYIKDIEKIDKSNAQAIMDAWSAYIESPAVRAVAEQMQKLKLENNFEVDENGNSTGKYLPIIIEDVDEDGNVTRRLNTESSMAHMFAGVESLKTKDTTSSVTLRDNALQREATARAAAAKAAQDKVNANLYTVTTPPGSQGAAFQNRKNQLLFTGFKNQDGTVTKGIVEEIYGDKAGVMKKAIEKSLDPFGDLMNKVRAGDFPEEKKKEYLATLQQYKNEELKLRAAGTAPYAEIVGSEKSVVDHQILNGAANTLYNTMNFKVGDGGEYTTFTDFNNKNKMWEMSNIDKDVAIPKSGTPGRHIHTGEIIIIPATMSAKERLNYEPVQGASFISNSVNIQPVDQGYNQMGYMAWANLQFEFGRKKDESGKSENTYQVIQSSTPLNLNEGGNLALQILTPSTTPVEMPFGEFATTTTTNYTVKPEVQNLLKDVGKIVDLTLEEFNEQKTNEGHLTAWSMEPDGRLFVRGKVARGYKEYIKENNIPNTENNRAFFMDELEKHYPGIQKVLKEAEDKWKNTGPDEREGWAAFSHDYSYDN